MRESAPERSRKYVKMTEASLRQLKFGKPSERITKAQVDHILELVQGYVRDAKHYAEKKKAVTSLACIAYAEGLLDALKFLELVEF